MKKSIAVLKGYFKTGDKPTQQQFYDFLESYLHLDSYILASQVTGLETALETLNALGISDVIGLQTALNDLNIAITTLEVADVSGLQGILDALAVVSIGDVTGLQAVLDDLATRGIADITGLSDALNGKVDKVAGYGLSQNDFSNYYTGLITTIQNAVTALIYEGIVAEATIIKTLALTDVNKRIVFSNANPIALTVPLDASVAWYTGTKIKGTVQGNGAVTISGAGITFIGNTLTFPKGESFVLINIGLDTWTVEGNAPTAGALVYKTWFVNTAIGNNTTGLYQDSSKPFATIDYILALPAFTSDDIIFLQNTNGTFPLNGTLPASKNVIINSDVNAVLSFSANANTDLMTTGATIKINLPYGSVINERSGGTGCYFYANGFSSALHINALSLYWNTSNIAFRLTYLKFSVSDVSVRGTLTNSNVGGVKDVNMTTINIDKFTCLADYATFAIQLDSRLSINISHIAGTGCFYFTGGRYNVGNITTTNPCVIGASYNNAFINFVNTYISTANGIDIAGDILYNVTITGNILYSPKITGGRSFRSATNIKYLNFSADLGAGTITLDQGTYSFENCSIKSNNSPITLIGGGTYNLALILKSSVFEVVNAVPLVTGGASSGDTIKVGGISTNATMISDQAGTGVTVTQFTNY